MIDISVIPSERLLEIEQEGVNLFKKSINDVIEKDEVLTVKHIIQELSKIVKTPEELALICFTAGHQYKILVDITSTQII